MRFSWSKVKAVMTTNALAADGCIDIEFGDVVLLDSVEGFQRRSALTSTGWPPKKWYSFLGHPLCTLLSPFDFRRAIDYSRRLLIKCSPA